MRIVSRSRLLVLMFVAGIRLVKRVTSSCSSPRLPRWSTFCSHSVHGSPSRQPGPLLPSSPVLAHLPNVTDFESFAFGRVQSQVNTPCFRRMGILQPVATCTVYDPVDPNITLFLPSTIELGRVTFAPKSFMLLFLAPGPNSKYASSSTRMALPSAAVSLANFFDCDLLRRERCEEVVQSAPKTNKKSCLCCQKQFFDTHTCLLTTLRQTLLMEHKWLSDLVWVTGTGENSFWCIMVH